jgi:hypothetical protein
MQRLKLMTTIKMRRKRRRTAKMAIKIVQETPKKLQKRKKAMKLMQRLR